jgi:hypothetical protein
MNDLLLFVELGFRHILDTGAKDHLMFLAALTVVFSIKDLKKLVVLVSLFTVAHTLSLALTAYRIVEIRSGFIEQAIVWTIIITALSNIIIHDKNKLQKIHLFYVFFFGLIHGMGFTHAFMMSVSGSNGILMPLTGFALGIEAGQVMFIFGFLVITHFVVERLLKVTDKTLILSVSFFILGYSLSLI